MEQRKLIGISVDAKTHNVVANATFVFTLAFFAWLLIKFLFNIDLVEEIKGIFSSEDPATTTTTNSDYGNVTE